MRPTVPVGASRLEIAVSQRKGYRLSLCYRRNAARSRLAPTGNGGELGIDHEGIYIRRPNYTRDDHGAHTLWGDIRRPAIGS